MLLKSVLTVLVSLGLISCAATAPGTLASSETTAPQEFVDNTRFRHAGMVFVAINMPGSNNNLVLNAKECTSKSARNAANVEYIERETANVARLAASFAQAKAQNALGLVLVVQGDPGFDLPETEVVDESTAPGVSGYRHFMSQLMQQTEQFKG